MSANDGSAFGHYTWRKINTNGWSIKNVSREQTKKVSNECK